MDRLDFAPEDSIAALATPWGESALAVIRVSGPDSLKRLDSVFSPGDGRFRLAGAGGHTLRRGRIVEPGGKPVDDVLVAVYRSPRSFTGEDGAEIFTHGSPLIIRRILDLLAKEGFRPAGPGEFTLRAFINGKLDLTQAEAVNEIVRAKTDRARAMALHRLGGSIEGKIRELKEMLLRFLAAVEVRIDYPEEELEEEFAPEAELASFQGELEKLLATFRIGRIYQEGVSAVLAGRTNSGKSTLFNRLLREERAIVSELHGTTRDYLEGMIDLEGIPVRLYDTAGYRLAGDAVELEGMRRTDAIVAGSQLVLYLVDAGAGLTDLDRDFIAEADDGRLIRIWSKTDLTSGPIPEGFIPLSARNGEGIEALCRAMHERILSGQVALEQEAPVIDSLRQKKLLERALEAFREFCRGLGQALPLDVLAVELKEALDALAEITGEVTSQDILDSIFSRFCVGK